MRKEFVKTVRRVGWPRRFLALYEQFMNLLFGFYGRGYRIKLRGVGAWVIKTGKFNGDSRHNRDLRCRRDLLRSFSRGPLRRIAACCHRILGAPAPKAEVNRSRFLGRLGSSLQKGRLDGLPMGMTGHSLCRLAVTSLTH
jgi:hypothetical protein